jgi:hypothetical protein
VNITLVVVCTALALLCVGIEWRRNATRRPARVVAALAVAVLIGALAMARHHLAPEVDRIVIPSSDEHEAAYADVEAATTRVVAGGIVRIEGDGLGDDALALLHAHRIEWEQSPEPVGLVRLSWPRRGVAGDRIAIMGELDVRDSSWVVLHHPDGRADSVRTDSVFTFTAAPRVPGPTLWTLEAGGGREVIGVDVRRPPTPAVVLVEGRPGREGAALARLVMAQGGGLLQRTRMTAYEDRITAWGTASPVRVLTDSLLARTDALVLGPGGVATLTRAERDAVARQLQRGLGVVHLVDSVLTRSPIFPFTVVRRGGGDDQVRVAIDSLHVSKGAIPAAALSISGGPPLLTTLAGAPVAWRTEVGEGALVATRITTPSRWALAGEESIEAAWWAALMGAALRPEAAEWRLATDALPRVDHPLLIERVGVSGDSAALGEGGTVSDVALRVGGDTLHRTITLWPRDTGWVSISIGADTLRVHVAPRAAFATLDRAVRRRATHEALKNTNPPSSPGAKPAAGVRVPPWLVWVLLIMMLAMLWMPSQLGTRER